MTKKTADELIIGKQLEEIKKSSDARLFEFLMHRDLDVKKHMAIWELQRRDRRWQFWLTVISVVIATIGVFKTFWK